MLVSMSNTMRTKLEKKEIVVEIFNTLQEIFDMQSEQACIELTRKYTSAKMNTRTSMSNHVMMMTNYFTDAEFHDALINKVTQVRIILNFLSHDFIQFTSNYIMNKLNYGLSQLLNKLQTFEIIKEGSKSSSFANVVSYSRVKHMKKKGNSKRTGEKSYFSKKKGSKGDDKSKVSKNKPKRIGKGNKSDDKGKYFHCNEQGH